VQCRLDGIPHFHRTLNGFWDAVSGAEPATRDKESHISIRIIQTIYFPLTDLVIIRYENGNKLMGRGEEWERKPSRT